MELTVNDKLYLIQIQARVSIMPINFAKKVVLVDCNVS
jgi:hypothetical protein